MTKKRISGTDLGWIILQELRESGKFPQNISVAIVSDESVGWRVVVDKDSRRFISAAGARFLADLQKRLHLEYELLDD